MGFWAWNFWPARGFNGPWWVPFGFVSLFAFLGLADIVTALVLRQGRRWPAIAAILIETLWATLAAGLGYKTLKDWPLDFQLLWQLTLGTTLFLAAVVGMLLRPIRAYAGLVRR